MSLQTRFCLWKKHSDTPNAAIRSVKNFENEGILSVKTINEEKS